LANSYIEKENVYIDDSNIIYKRLQYFLKQYHKRLCKWVSNPLWYNE